MTFAGLSEAEAQQRLAACGANALPETRTRSFGAVLGGTLREPIFVLLLAASALYLLLGELGEGLFLVAGACLAVGLTAAQELRSERALAALRELSQPMARVIRDSVHRSIAARDLVPGDVMLVGEGERLPADGRLVGGDVLRVDESTLTGESAPVEKAPGPSPVEGELFAGTMIVQGNGIVEVTRTGKGAAIGRIGASLAGLSDTPTHLQLSARRIVRLLSMLALVFCAVVAAAYGLVHGDWVEGALAGITVSISLIPEEFPMVLAVFMALGAWRLARHKVLVRRGAIIEALGGATLLCVDKTGTLTENRMRVVRLWAAGDGHEVSEESAIAPEAAALLRAAALASVAHSADPMDQAVLALEATAREERSKSQPRRSWPLSPERLAIVQVWGEGEGEVAAAKGAPETIFKLCRFSEDDAAQLRAELDSLAAEGLRVLAVASCSGLERFPSRPEDAIFTFRGFLGFLDPVRADVPTALAEARAAGISVAMITGDYPATALVIARDSGIDVSHGVLTGKDIAGLAVDELRERVRDVRVFARIAPEQKLQLVQAFQAEGHVVAMTGDGVNDAPALKAAQIGIAMGRRGADVAREAADLVLLDDSFGSIVGAVRLGRRIFANLRKALTFVTAVHVPIAGVALLPILFGLPPMLFPMHVVLLELVIDPVCSLVFEAEPSEARAMRRPPRTADESLFGGRELRSALAQGAVVMAAVVGFYGWASQIAPELEARGAAFTCLVVANLALALSNVAADGVRLFDSRRQAFWIIAITATVVLGAVLFAPPISRIFQVSTPRAALLGIAIAAGATSGAAWRLAGVSARLNRPRKVLDVAASS